MDKPAASMGLQQNSFRLVRRLQGRQRALSTSVSNTAAFLIIAFVFVNFLVLGYKIGGIVGETETVKQYLDGKSSTKYLRSP